MRPQFLIGIELFRPRQRLGFSDGGAEPLPLDHRRDRVERVLLAVVGGDQRGADTRIEADLLIDGARIGLEGVGVPANSV